MTSFSELSQSEQDRLEEAADWRLRVQDCQDEELPAAFLEWMRDAANREAFEFVSIGLDTVDQFQTTPELLALRQNTLSRVRKRGAERWRPIRGLRYLAAGAVILVVAVAGAFWLVQRPTTYETAIGERRSITLADGSRISLDSVTEVNVRFMKNARDLELVRGRARFDVAHDVSRPFSVRAGAETVVAVGTAFDVERLGKKVLVTLIQGHVVIKSSAPQILASVATPAARQPVPLAAGQQLVATANTGPVVVPADLHIATAWETGQLVFHDETLGEAVEQVNRYATQPINVDPLIAGIRVSGVFNAGDINSFLSTVTSYLPVVASTTADNQVLLAPRQKGS